MKGNFSGSGHSDWRIAPSVTWKFSGLSPAAVNVHIGAPDPPENRDHCN
jgi:hypothetical protein